MPIRRLRLTGTGLSYWERYWVKQKKIKGGKKEQQKIDWTFNPIY
jgi:hypothetical protein